MKWYVYSIYDVGVKTWRPPVFVRARRDIWTEWVSACNKAESEFCKYAEDFALFELGSWDDDKCLFDCHKIPELVGKAIESKHAVMDDMCPPGGERGGAGVAP